MTKRYSILRDMSNMPSREPFGHLSRSAGVARSTVFNVVPEPRVDTEELTTKELADLNRDTTIVGIAPIMPTQLIVPVEVEDTGAMSTWGVNAVGADASAFDGAGVTVAVLDTGIDADHPAFTGVELVQQDFSGSGNGDLQGHGTHCAGTIFGRDVDGTCIGVARGVPKALIGKVLGDNGGGDSDMLFRGIFWAVDQGARVISMSLGFNFPGLVTSLINQGWPSDIATSAALEAYRGNLRMFDALMGMIRARAAFGNDAVVVAAAGNESRRQMNPNFEIAASLPAAAEGVISVGALQQAGNQLQVAGFSNTLPQISAPGVGIVSAKAGGNLTKMSGTSMACPHVAGCAALWWQAVTESAIPPNAGNVVAKLLSQAHSTVFAPTVDMADRGVGLVRAP
ncbi:S8 family serine peptidase [Thiothrix subterranea]|uniref:S8 family peptidase n=1 Tax=Thiothrix subterranea TaxID=2735563 RepID=UPI00192B7404|nr:S8 family serine peptidase [Thiothrix subterranea]QQZ28034.1 S8 family serine peptidase [Thiothrix subterranea]